MRTFAIQSRSKDLKYFRNFKDREVVDNYDRAIELVGPHFSRKKSIDYEVFQYRQAKQLSDKTLIILLTPMKTCS